MSHRREVKHAPPGGVDLSDYVSEYKNTVLVVRVRSLLRTWEQFGGGSEENMISELREALGPEEPNPWTIPAYTEGT